MLKSRDVKESFPDSMMKDNYVIWIAINNKILTITKLTKENAEIFARRFFRKVKGS